MLKQKIQLFLQHIVPQHLLSRLAGRIANCQWPWLKNLFIRWFVQHYQVDMSAAIQTDPLQYPCFNSFFTRHLKPEARPIASGEQTVVSPVDGDISQFGSIEQNRLLQAKGFDYDVMQLLGGETKYTTPFLNGDFFTIYLAPKDYHRIHMPIAGKLQHMIYIPGNLFSVNFYSADHIPNLFTRNERVVCFFETAVGPMVVALVGAMIVGSISTSWAKKIAPTKQRQITHYDYTKESIYLEKGEELGYFEMGSTVIVLFEHNRITWSSDIEIKQSVLFGQKMAELTDNTALSGKNRDHSLISN